MEQLKLFQPQSIAQREIRDAIERLDFAMASRRLFDFRSTWPEAELTWEPELIRVGSKLASQRLHLDAGWEAWVRLESGFGRLGVPPASAAAIRKHFFSRLLASHRRLFEETRTAAGRSLGDFYRLAEQPRNARRLYERERRQMGDRWELRLGLGNCCFKLGAAGAARSNYHWAFLLGLPPAAWSSIEDRELQALLGQAEDPDWAFPELCTGGQIPSGRFSSRVEFDDFRAQFLPFSAESDPAKRFSCAWVVSENKAFISQRELLEARRLLKALNPHLHARYLQRLD